MALIELKDVSKAYDSGNGKTYVLKNVNLSVEKGDFISIMGPSGSGKTTLLNIIGGLDRPTSGSYLFAGEAVEKKRERELAKLRGGRIGFVFQMFNLIPRLTVFRNAELPMVYAGVPASERYERVMAALRAVGLEEKADRTPDKLSGGEVQRVAIARALINDPDVILADEPTGNLDSKTGKDILNVLASLNRSGRTIILVTHNAQIAAFAKRQVRIFDGVVQEASR